MTVHAEPPTTRGLLLTTLHGDTTEPDWADVSRALDELLRDPALRDDGFVILARDETFVQTEGETLEHCNGSEIFRVDALDHLRPVFEAFYAGEALPTAVEWRDVTEEVLSPPSRNAAFRVLIVLIALAAFWAFVLRPILADS
ncbi:MAG: hypothetical protein AAGD14_04770 [Planctomycetota bacterium]